MLCCWYYIHEVDKDDRRKPYDKNNYHILRRFTIATKLTI